MDILLYIPILFFSVVLHEYMHGYVAYRCGDDTAYLMGRLTFNPAAHVDMWGTIIIPAMCYISGLPMFGWAKPVPVNYYRLHNPKNDMAKVSLAGPLSNVFLIVVAALLLKILIIADYNAVPVLSKALVYMIAVNLMLSIFNLIPIPPLDGSKVLAALLPTPLSVKYMRLERFSMIIIIVLIVSGAFRLILVPLFNFFFSLILTFIGAGNVKLF